MKLPSQCCCKVYDTQKVKSNFVYSVGHFTDIP